MSEAKPKLAISKPDTAYLAVGVIRLGGSGWER